MNNRSEQDTVLLADADRMTETAAGMPMQTANGGAVIKTTGGEVFRTTGGAVTAPATAPAMSPATATVTATFTASATATADSRAHQTAAELVAAAAAAAAEQAEALAALKKLSKEEALRMFETQNPTRRDSATEQIVQHGIELQGTHGTKFAAAYLEEHKVPLDVGRRVLLTPLKRRAVRSKR